MLSFHVFHFDTIFHTYLSLSHTHAHVQTHKHISFVSFLCFSIIHTFIYILPLHSLYFLFLSQFYFIFFTHLCVILNFLLFSTLTGRFTFKKNIERGLVCRDQYSSDRNIFRINIGRKE